MALHQIWHHQRWLAAFPSRGSSANNHVDRRGRRAARRGLRVRLVPVLAAVAGRRAARRWTRQLRAQHLPLRAQPGAGHRVPRAGAGAGPGRGGRGGRRGRGRCPRSTRLVLLRMTDALAAVVDNRLRPPRQGDADDGHGLVVDGADTDRWASLLATGDAVFGRLAWWPDGARRRCAHPAAGRADPSRTGDGRGAARQSRPAHFADAGLTILRGPGEQIWCRCDGGPHGFLSIAAHAHADALSVEVRHDGVDVLADPGTYCYHGQPEWRSYFRSTLGHNTLELGGRDQSRVRRPVPVDAARRDPGAERWTRPTGRRRRAGAPSTTATGRCCTGGRWSSRTRAVRCGSPTR